MKHKAIEYGKNKSKGLLEKTTETFLFVTMRAHTKEICWRSYSHVKIAATCTVLSLDDEQCDYSGRDGVIGHLGVQMRMRNKENLFLYFSMK